MQGFFLFINQAFINRMAIKQANTEFTGVSL
jgi:hypothetical protein